MFRLMEAVCYAGDETLAVFVKYLLFGRLAHCPRE